MRYFVLRDRKLLYSKKKGEKIKGILNFDLVQCIFKHDSHKLRFR